MTEPLPNPFFSPGKLRWKTFFKILLGTGIYAGIFMAGAIGTEALLKPTEMRMPQSQVEAPVSPELESDAKKIEKAKNFHDSNP